MTRHRPGMATWRRAGLALLLGGGAALAQADGEAAPSVELATGAGWHFSAPPPATLAALDRAWGQFELRLPVRGFVLPAPNCRDEIRLRWIALTPDEAGRAGKLQARWEQLERLKALQAPGSSAAPERVTLSLRHYTRRGKDGRWQLQYCNAFVNDGGR